MIGDRYRKSETKGQVGIFASNIFFALAAILVKSVPGHLGGIFISLFRFSLGIILGVLVLALSKSKFKIQGKADWLLRGIFGAASMICYFLAIQITSSGRATLLVNTFPIFVAVFGFLFFKEKIYWNNLVSLALCILGVAFVFYDESQYHFSGDLLGLLGGLLAGMAVHYIKKSRQKNNPAIVYLSACIIGSMICMVSINQAIFLDWQTLLILLGVGICAFLAQLTMTYGYKYVAVVKGSIITFLKIPLTMLLSLLIGEEFKTRFIIGTVLIISGLIINRK